VTLAGVDVAEVSSESDESVVVVAAASEAVAGDVVLTAASGATIVQANAWEYITPGEIGIVTPDQGQTGTSVEINGTGLLAGGDEVSEVWLSGIEATSVLSSSETRVVAEAASGTDEVVGEAGNVVLVANTGGVVTLIDGFTYLEEGKITSVEPSSGQGGAYVAIEGSRLRGGGSNIISATVSGVDALVIGENDTHATLRIGHADPGAGHVVLTAESGATVTAENAFTYDVAGEITDIDPPEGQLNTRVSISGSVLRGYGGSVETVKLSGLTATILSQNDSLVVVSAPASAGSSGSEVTLIADNGATTSIEGLWTYRTEGVIESVLPSFGQVGTNVTIAGASLRGGGSSIASVFIGDHEATVLVDTDTELIVSSGDNSGRRQRRATEVVDVVLTADSFATVTLEDGFTYLEKGAIASVAPGSGQFGTSVTIRGERLHGGGEAIAAVTLGGVQAVSVDDDSNTTVIVTAAASDAADQAEAVQLIADTGALTTIEDAWQYIAEGEITSVSPGSGHSGTVVTINGTSLLGGGNTIASVSLAGSDCADIDDSDTSIKCTAGEGSEGTGDVVLVSDTGAVVTLSDGFSYIAPGVVDLVTPNRGQLGTYVSLHGSNLLSGGSTVRSLIFDGVDAIEVVEASDELIRIRAGESFDYGLADIAIISDTGSEVLLTNGWTFDIPSNITNTCV
jgi:hypothetical protein